MKQFPAILLIASVFALSVFGLLLMAHENGHSGCIASAMSGEACPNNPIADINFHVDTFHNLSVGIARNAVLAITTILTLALAMLGFSFLSRAKIPQLRLTGNFIRRESSSWQPKFTAIASLRHWAVETRTDAACA
jgi:hypothetical protein